MDLCSFYGQQVEVLSPINGDLRASLPNVGDADLKPEEDSVVGLHLFRKKTSDLSSRYLKSIWFVFNLLQLFLEFELKVQLVCDFLLRIYCVHRNYNECSVQNVSR